MVGGWIEETTLAPHPRWCLWNQTFSLTNNDVMEMLGR